MMPSLWILTDGRIGTENNARGLAEALGLAYEVKKISLRQPWKTFSPWLRCGLKHGLTGEPLTPPWPDILLTAGRTPAVGSVYIGQQSPSMVRIHITNPGVNSALFDLVIAPAHDQLSGSNVISTTGALHRITPQKLAEAATLWGPRWAHLPRPWHAVLAGGDAHGYRLDAATATDLMQKIKALGGSVLATASRRTGPEARAAIAAHADYLWDGMGDNPFLGLLALAANLFVTCDSVSMLSEAASSGKPTYLLELAGPGDAKLRRCHEALLTGNYLRRFSGKLVESPTTRLHDIARVVPKVQELLIARGKLSR